MADRMMQTHLLRNYRGVMVGDGISDSDRYTSARIQKPPPIKVSNVAVSGLLYVFYIVFIFLSFVFMNLGTLLPRLHYILILVGLYLASNFVVVHQADFISLFLESYELIADLYNYVAQQLNDIFNILRPFIPLYNYYTLWNQKLAYLFRLVVSPELFEWLVRTLIDVVWQIMPVFITVIQALIPAMASIIPQIVILVQAIIGTFLQPFIDFVITMIGVVVALLPSMKAIIIAMVVVLELVVQQFSQYFTIFAEMLVTVLDALIPALTPLLTILITFVSNVATDLSTQVAPTTSVGFGLVLFGFLFVVFKNAIPLVKELIQWMVSTVLKLVTDHLPEIVEFVSMIIGLLPKLMLAIADIIVAIFTGPIFTQLIALVIVLVRAVIDLIPVLMSVLLQLANPTLLFALFTAIVESVTIPHSPVVFGSIAVQLANVLSSSVTVVVSLAVELVKMVVVLVPPIVNIIPQLLQSGILENIVRVLIDIVVKTIPELIKAIVFLFTDVLLVVVLRLLLEVLLPLVGDVIKIVIKALSALLIITLNTVIIIFISILRALPLLFMLWLEWIILIVTEASVILSALISTTVYLIKNLMLNLEIRYLVAQILLGLVNMALFVVFGIKFEFMQAILDVVFELLIPIFSTLTGLSGNLDISQLVGSAGAAASDALKDIISGLMTAISSVTGMLSFFKRISGVLDFIGPVIQGAIKYAADIFFNYIVKVLCPLDLLCCVFVQGECCIFPALCACCCTVDICPPSGVGCSCFFG